MTDEGEELPEWLAELGNPRRDTFHALANLGKDIIHEHGDRQILEALDELTLPMILPGETTYEHEPLQPGDDRGTRPIFFDPDGWPIDGDSPERRWGAEKADDANYYRASLFADGIGVWVSTAYLGIDHNFFGSGPPIIWETMIQTQFQWTGWQHRYCTRAAAWISHTRIVERLQEMGMVLADAGTGELEA